MKSEKTERKVIGVVGEVTRIGEDYPLPTQHSNEDGTITPVIYFDVRATESRNGTNIYKVQVRGTRVLEAFSKNEFEHIPAGEWFKFKAPALGDWVELEGSHATKPPSKEFDKPQNMLTIWEPWNIKSRKRIPRPAKKTMQTY
jgi:hypothetical protein